LYPPVMTRILTAAMAKRLPKAKRKFQSKLNLKSIYLRDWRVQKGCYRTKLKGSEENLPTFLSIRHVHLLCIIVSPLSFSWDTHFPSVVISEAKRERRQMILNQYCALSTGLN
jgi:hypothetical protein